MQLIVATRNAHKAREIQRIFGPAFTVSDLSEHPEIPEIRENGKSFEENAILKAIGASRHLPGLIVADDSGLEVDALGGAPGIFSARYAGENATDKQNVDKLLVELARTGAKETKSSLRDCAGPAGQTARDVRRNYRGNNRRANTRITRIWLRSHFCSAWI